MNGITRIVPAIFVLAVFCAPLVGAERIACFPLLQYEQLFLADRPVVSPSVGVIAQSTESDAFLGVFVYTATFSTEASISAIPT